MASHSLDSLIARLRSLVTGRFYGKLTITFQAGKICTIKKEETLTADK